MMSKYGDLSYHANDIGYRRAPARARLRQLRRFLVPRLNSTRCCYDRRGGGRGDGRGGRSGGDDGSSAGGVVTNVAWHLRAGDLCDANRTMQAAHFDGAYDAMRRLAHAMDHQRHRRALDVVVEQRGGREPQRSRRMTHAAVGLAVEPRWHAPHPQLRREGRGCPCERGAAPASAAATATAAPRLASSSASQMRAVRRA